MSDNEKIKGDGKLNLRQFFKYKLIPAAQLAVIFSVLVAAFFSIIFGGEESLPSCRAALQLGDLNTDGAFTIKDIWPNLVEIFNFPYAHFSQHPGLVALGNFFEVSDRGCRSWPSRILNILMWAIFIFIFGLLKWVTLFNWGRINRDAEKASGEISMNPNSFGAKWGGAYFNTYLWPILWLALLNSISIQSLEIRKVVVGHRAERAPAAEFPKPKSKDNQPRAQTPKRDLEKSDPSPELRSEAHGADSKLQKDGGQNSVPIEHSSGF